METQAPGQVDPSKLPFESVGIRRRIIASYWLVVFLAVPLWWVSTSIERLPLPTGKVAALDAHKLRFPVRIGVSSDVPSFNVEEAKSEIIDTLRIDQQRHEVHLDSPSSAVTDLAFPGTYGVIFETGDPLTLLTGRQLRVRSPRGADEDTRSAAWKILKKLIVPRSLQDRSLRVVKYSPRYRLAFSLLNEDASSGKGVISWDVKEAIQRYLTPTIERFSVVHNFTIESQVQYHAPLAFQTKDLQVEGEAAHGLTPEDLTVFVNSADWTLSSSVSNDPVIHFVLFVPSSQNTPLYILNTDGNASSSDAFILPQWGGISILDSTNSHLSVEDLCHTFTTIQHQLLALLGVPALPANVEYDLSEPLTDWQLDALVRLRTKQNVDNSKETLKSIVALVDQIENMPVGQDVRGDVQGALSALDVVFAEGPSSLMSTLRHSSDALTRASRAFFNPGMLALLYFPAEHKYAVYTPLFASVAAPLLAAVVREVVAWKKARKANTQAGNAAAAVGRAKTD